MSMPFERSDQTDNGSAQPETVATLLRQLGVRNASGVQEADALRAWVRDNGPNRALRLSIRRNGCVALVAEMLKRADRHDPVGGLVELSPNPQQHSPAAPTVHFLEQSSGHERLGFSTVSVGDVASAWRHWSSFCHNVIRGDFHRFR